MYSQATRVRRFGNLETFWKFPWMWLVNIWICCILIGPLLEILTSKNAEYLAQGWHANSWSVPNFFCHFQFEKESTGMKLSIFMLISARWTTTITSLATFPKFTTRKSCIASTVEFQQVYNWHKLTPTSMPNSLNRESKVKLNLF